MTLPQKYIALFFFGMFLSCNKSASEKTEIIEKDSLTGTITDSKPSDATFDYSKDLQPSDTTTIIKFEELSVSICRMVIYDEEKKLDLIQKEYVVVHAELGESVEDQLITIATDKITNVKIEQRYETSVTIMNEGPHCDLTEWKHYNSEWKPLLQNSKGQFIGAKYSEKETQMFPNVSIEELKQAVKAQCGGEWLQLHDEIKSPTQYPSAVGISRYFLKISGQRKDNNQTVTKIIEIENPMGC